MKKRLIAGGILLVASAYLHAQPASARCLSAVVGNVQLNTATTDTQPLLDPGIDLSPPTALSFPAGCYARTSDYANGFYVGYPVTRCIGAIEGRLGI